MTKYLSIWVVGYLSLGEGSCPPQLLFLGEELPRVSVSHSCALTHPVSGTQMYYCTLCSCSYPSLSLTHNDVLLCPQPHRILHRCVLLPSLCLAHICIIEYHSCPFTHGVSCTCMNSSHILTQKMYTVVYIIPK